VISKTLLDKGIGSITLFSFAADRGFRTYLALRRGGAPAGRQAEITIGVQ
jgi:hypothetical protein